MIDPQCFAFTLGYNDFYQLHHLSKNKESAVVRTHLNIDF